MSEKPAMRCAPESEAESRVELALVLTPPSEVSPLGGAESLLDPVAEFKGDLLHCELLVKLPAKKDVFLETSPDVGQALSWLCPAFREAAQCGFLRVAQSDGELKRGLHGPAFDRLGLDGKRRPGQSDDMTEREDAAVSHLVGGSPRAEFDSSMAMNGQVPVPPAVVSVLVIDDSALLVARVL